MAKKSRKRVARYEKDRSGCMWGLMSIFDFRQAHSSQRLLSERKHWSRRLSGASCSNLKLDSLGDDVHRNVDGDEKGEIATADGAKLRVKELMEEEMFADQDPKNDPANTDVNPEPTPSRRGLQAKKNRKRSSKHSFDISDLYFSEDVVSEKPVHRKHKSSSSIDLNVMMQEISTQINPKDIDNELLKRSNEDCVVTEEKLGEATKVLVDHFSDGKPRPAKELLDALWILNSNKEMFLKLLRDPESKLVKDAQKLQDFRGDEDRNSKMFLGWKEGGGVQRSFFWRKLKGMERSVSKKNNTSKDLDKIVVLKPDLPESRNLETFSNDSSSQSCQSAGNKVQNERGSSAFSFTEIKRKLRYALRKDQRSSEQPNLGNGASPSRERFFIERIPKPPGGVKGGKVGRSKEGTLSGDPESVLNPDQRESDIYTEAKKHLAEIILNSDIDSSSLAKQAPKPLGRMLSYAESSSPILFSPRETESTASQPQGECKFANEDKRQVMCETDVDKPVTLNIEATRIDKRVLGVGDPDSGSSFPDGLSCNDDVDKTFGFEGDEGNFEGYAGHAEIASLADITEPKENNQGHTSSEPCGSPHNRMDQTDNSRNVCENELSLALEQDTCEENDLSSFPSSSSSSPSQYSITDKVEDLDSTSDEAGRPSPVSVLEPLFKENDVNPSDLEPFQPRKIIFEEEASTPSYLIIRERTCIEDEKYVFEFVKTVVQISGLTWHELRTRLLFSDHIIDPAVLDEVSFLPVPETLCYDQKLLFDLIDEAVMETYESNFSYILSFSNRSLFPEFKGKDLVDEIRECVDWYIRPRCSSRTLEEIVSMDHSKSGSWMHLKNNTEQIGIVVEDTILDELIEELIWNCVSDFPIPILCEVGETESNIDQGT